MYINTTITWYLFTKKKLPDIFKIENIKYKLFIIKNYNNYILIISNITFFNENLL